MTGHFFLVLGSQALLILLYIICCSSILLNWIISSYAFLIIQKAIDFFCYFQNCPQYKTDDTVAESMLDSQNNIQHDDRIPIKSEQVEQVEDVVLITEYDFPESPVSHENAVHIPPAHATNDATNRITSVHTESQKRTWTDTSYNDNYSTKQARYNVDELNITDNNHTAHPLSWNYNMNDITGDPSQTGIPSVALSNSELFDASSSAPDAVLSQSSNPCPEWLNSVLGPCRRPRHSQDKRFICHHEGCSRQFYYKGDLARHLRINHKT